MTNAETSAGKRPVHHDQSAALPIRIEGSQQRALETARSRLLAAGGLFILAFLVVMWRLVDLAAFDVTQHQRRIASIVAPAVIRADIVDRNGVLLATSLPTASLFADPKEVIDPKAAMTALTGLFPDLDRQWLLAKLSGTGRFVWVRRNLTPDEQYAVNKLGIPGLGFQQERRRIYPHGRVASHILGMTDVDEIGIAGVERTFDSTLSNGERLELSLDIRVQQILREELYNAQREFSAVGSSGIVLDVASGEILGMVSLPDFDPNAPANDPEDNRFNRITKGAYEIGSVFKLFTTAMALDSGRTTLQGGYDATRPLHVARFTISDYHPARRWLSVPEILVHSSNIGSALMALDVGTDLQRQYLDRFGLLSPTSTDLPEVGEPLVPNPWREINTMTIGFGHGIAVTPLQLSSAVAAVVNGGILRRPTLLRRGEDAPVDGKRVLSTRTSRQMRSLMRLVVSHGTGARAEVPGYRVGGKTGTAEKQIGGRYHADKRISSFVGAFPMDAPRFVVLAMLDEPKGSRRTFNYATGGWVAAPVVSRVIQRMAPVLGIAPAVDDPETLQAKTMTRKERLTIAIQQAIAESRGTRVAAN